MKRVSSRLLLVLFVCLLFVSHLSDLQFGFVPSVKAQKSLPSTVGTSTTEHAISRSHQRKTFYALNRFWVFASDGTNMVWYTSSDGTSWSAKNTVPARPCSAGRLFCIDSNGTHVWYVYCPETSNQPIKWRRGTLATDGTISWGTEYNAVAAVPATKYSYLSVKVDTSNYAFIQYEWAWTDPEGYTWCETRVTKNGRNDGVWGSPTTWTLSTTVSGANCLVQLTSGRMYAIYSSAVSIARGRLYSAGSWGPEETLSSYYTQRHYISATNEGDHIHFVQSTTAYASYTGYPSPNQDTEYAIYGSLWLGQSFKPSQHGECTALAAWLRRGAGTSDVPIKYRLYNAGADGKPTGDYFYEGTIASFTETTYSWRNHTITVAPHNPVLNSSLTYVFVVLAPTGTTTNYYLWGCDSSSPTYAHGSWVRSTDGGVTWTVDTGIDNIFDVESKAYRIFYRKRTYGVGWGAEYHVANTHQSSAPAISILTSNNNLYVWWASCPADNHIYYRMYNASSASWASIVDWRTESDLRLEEIVTATYASANYVSFLWMIGTSTPFYIRHDYLPIIIGYNLNLRVKDYDLTDNIANAIVYKDSDTKVSDSSGWANWTAVSGTVNIKVKYYGFWVNGTFSISVSSDTTLDIRCNLYDVYGQVLPANQQGVLYTANVTVFNSTSVEANKIRTALSNETGYAYLPNLPNNTLTFTVYAKSDYSLVIANVTRTPTSDEQVLTAIVCDQNYGNVSIPWEMVMMPISVILQRKKLKNKQRKRINHDRVSTNRLGNSDFLFRPFSGEFSSSRKI